MVKLVKGHFSGLSKVFSAEDDGLLAVLRAIVSDNAMARLQAAINTPTAVDADTGAITTALDVEDDLTFTDNSTGTVGEVVVDIALPAAGATVASGTTGAALTALNTALGKTENALKVIHQLVAQVRAESGQDDITVSAGTVASAGTIPAQDKTTSTGASGTSAADFASARDAFKVAKSNVYKTALVVDETLRGIGLAGLDSSITASLETPLVIADIPTVSAAATGGVNALLKADADAFLVGLANDIATIADVWNDQIADVATATPSVTVG